MKRLIDRHPNGVAAAVGAAGLACLVGWASFEDELFDRREPAPVSPAAPVEVPGAGPQLIEGTIVIRFELTPGVHATRRYRLEPDAVTELELREPLRCQ